MILPLITSFIWGSSFVAQSLGDGKMISPAKFIPIAEKNGTIIPIGNWVLEQSIRTLDCIVNESR